MRVYDRRLAEAYDTVLRPNGYHVVKEAEDEGHIAFRASKHRAEARIVLAFNTDRSILIWIETRGWGGNALRKEILRLFEEDLGQG